MENIGPIAVIDVGAHFARLEIAQIVGGGEKYETLEQLSQTTPLGLDVFNNGKISSKSMILVGKILKEFSGVIKEYKAGYIKAIATSAVREATNSELFIDRVWRISGIKLKILESSEEARIMFLAMRRAINNEFDFNKKKSMVCAIGTGTTQISFIEKGLLKSSETVRLGALRLIEELERPMKSKERKEAIEPFVKAEARGVMAQTDLSLKKGFMLGLGSSVRMLLQIDPSIKLANKRAASLTKSHFKKIYKKISDLSSTDLSEKYNISETLAKSIEPSCEILLHFLNASSVNTLVIPLVSTRDAVINDFINEISGVDDPFTPHLISCVKTLAKKYVYDAEHSEAVAEAAEIIFDKTYSLHGLSSKYKMLLRIAALLHDIGVFVNSRRHHKHSYYLIQNSQIPGLKVYDKDIIATIARYHRRAFPKITHPEYALLSPSAKVIATSLAAILRIADAIAFTHNLKIVDVKINHDKQLLEISLNGAINPILDNWTTKRKADFFRDIFGLKIQLIGK